MTDTPFTDSCTYGFTDEDGIHCEAVHADVARTLERERDRYKSDVEVITKERDEAREALRVLFNDYKELADSGDAGFWEPEDKEAAQPALRIFQQMDATNPTTKSKQVSSKLVVIKTASNL